MKNVFNKAVITTAIAATAFVFNIANAQNYSGAGSTNSNYSQQYQHAQREQAERNRIHSQPQWQPAPPQPAVQQPDYSDPRHSWKYRAVERAAPIVRDVRDCAFGSLAGVVTAWGNPYGLVTGCAGGVINNHVYDSSPWNYRQAR